MKKMIRFLTGFILVMGIVAGAVAGMPVTTYAASVFVDNSSDMIGHGGYIYYIRTSTKDGSSSIWRMKVVNGEKSKVISEPNRIDNLVASGQQLYYTAANNDSQREVHTCRLNGDDAQMICEGTVCYADSESVYIRNETGGQEVLYAKDILSGVDTVIRTMKAGQMIGYVCNIGSDSYYDVYDPAADKLVLYRLNTATKKLIRVAAEKRMVEGSAGALQVSDVKQIEGELYYDFGSYEGSGCFWNGTIKKLTVDGKKKTVAKLVDDEKIIAGSRELYFSTLKGDTYKYNLRTGKKTKYSLRFENGISYTVLGDKTYMADTSNKKKIVISRFTSGTDRQTPTKNFISIDFKQKANVSYAVSMKQVGNYNLICVTGTDFTDQKYGWRGKTVSINWYVTDRGAGTLLGSFR